MEQDVMDNPLSEIEKLVSRFQALPAPVADAAPYENTASMRERFFELMVLSLANLYGKTPVAVTLFDRMILKRVTDGLDDNEAGKLSLRTEDWMRLEWLVRGQEGTKAYFLSRMSLAVLSTMTSEGTLGEVLEKIQAQYAAQMPSPELRKVARLFGAYFITRLTAA
jgi:hypothetical protein